MADVNQQLKDFADAVNASVDAVGASLDKIATDITEIGQDIDALMAGQVSPETLAALDSIKTKVGDVATRVSGEADALDAVNARNPNAPPPPPPTV